MSNVMINNRNQVVAWLTLNRPEALNALNNDTVLELSAAFRELSKDNDIRAIVLTGAGDRAFCAGGDIKSCAIAQFLANKLQLSDSFGPETNAYLARVCQTDAFVRSQEKQSELLRKQPELSLIAR